MITRLGQLEQQLFAYVHLRQLRTVQTGDLLAPLRLSPQQEHELLSRVARKGMIVRVRRGLYLVPPRLPLGGRWSPSEILALDTLIKDHRGGQYQMCGPNAFHRYGLDEQVPNRLYAYTNCLSGERRVGAVAMTLIKVADERLGRTESVETPEGLTAVYASRVRTLVDAVYDWSRFNSLPRGYSWIRQELLAQRVRASELVQVTLEYGDIGTIRRMGVLLEQEGVSPRLVQTLRRALRPSSSLIPWIPTIPKRGTVHRRWGVVVNEEGDTRRDHVA